MSEPRVVFCECGAYTMGFDPATSGEDEHCVIVITAGGEIVHRARTWERTAAVLVMKMDGLDKALARISALEAEKKRLAARADELESWMETVLNYYPHLEDGAPTGARADAAHPEGRNA